ncbi:hypothetical protein BD779DRAFT_1553456 [Infundibulicybe gibba]|nr:hypothetical protein BD779DRAFT_1553456 [Infundibulicybe gibba]
MHSSTHPWFRLFTLIVTGLWASIMGVYYLCKSQCTIHSRRQAIVIGSKRAGETIICLPCIIILYSILAFRLIR